MFCASYQQYRIKGFLVLPVLLFLLFGSPASADFQKGSDAMSTRKTYDNDGLFKQLIKCTKKSYIERWLNNS